MDTNNWRPAQGAVEPTMDSGDWRTQLQPDSRQRIVNKIMDTLKRHLPFSGQEGLQELRKIAVRFEEKIYTAATSQSDYLRKISLKMLTMETKSQNTIANPLPSNSASNSKNPPDTGSHGMQSQIGNQGQSLPIPMVANQAQARQQLLSQNMQNNISSTGAQGSASLTSALPPVGGLAPTTVPNVNGQNSNLQSITNISGVTQNSVGNSMGQAMSSNIFASSQRQMPGRQQQVPQQQQQQSQNLQNYLYQQQLQVQQQIMKQKYQQGSIPHMQTHMQQQQPQQQQNLLQPNQLQSSQQSVLQPSVMQTAQLSGLQQNHQSSVQQSAQPMLQQSAQSGLRQQQQQQQQQIPCINQQQTPMQSILPAQQPQQQPNSANLQQNLLMGQQNSIPDMQHQQQRFLGQQNNLSNLQQQQLQQQQQMSHQNNLPNIHQQQQLGSQGNLAALQQNHQQQLLLNQSGNSSMQTNHHSVHMLQQSKVPLQQQNQQNSAALLPTQGQQSEPQPTQQQLMSQIQSQPGQLQQQLGLQQQPNSLQRDMQRLQATGPLIQPQNIIDQQKQIFQSQRAIPEASSTSLDSTAQTGNANSGDWQEEVYQKIRTMRDTYLPELNEMYQKIAGKLQQHDSLPQQPKNEQLEKLKIFKTMLERIMAFLQVTKNNILPGYKDKLGSYEKQIINFLNSNRPRKPGPSLQQGQQLPPPHMHPMQQSNLPQSQVPQIQAHENQMNSQLQSMNLQGL